MSNTKTALVTGASQGIGKAIATALATQSYIVYLLSSTRAKLEAAAKDIRAVRHDADVRVLVCDLSDPTSVRAAATEFRATNNRLDVLVNNAGLFVPKRTLTPDGVEKTLAIGYVGHVLLTQLLLESLRASDDGRVVCMTVPPRQVKVRFDDISLAKGYSIMKASPQSKAALQMFVRELARRPEGKGITVTATEPGLVKTDILKETSKPMHIFLQIVGTTVEKGADSAIWLATAPQATGAAYNGKFFSKRKEKPWAGQVADATSNAKMWDIGQKLAGLA